MKIKMLNFKRAQNAMLKGIRLYEVQYRTLKGYKKDHFEAHLMLSSRVVNSRVLRMHGHLVENGKYILGIAKAFS